MSCKNNSLDINPGDSRRNGEDGARHLPDPSPPENHDGHDPSGISRVSGQSQANYMRYGYPTAPAGRKHRPAFVPSGQEKVHHLAAPWLAHGIAQDADDLPVDTSRVGFTKSLARSGLPAR